MFKSESDEEEKQEVEPVTASSPDDSRVKKLNKNTGILPTTINDTLQSMSCFDKQWKKIAWGVFGFSVLFIAVVLTAVSFQKLKSTEYGLEVRKAHTLFLACCLTTCYSINA